MEQLIAHLVGDYILQNHWMATQKTSRWFAALTHAIFYTIPFVVLFGGSWALIPICLTHAVIDRYRLIRLWLNFWGVGCSGSLWTFFGAPEIEAPLPFLSVWLMIIADNTLHLAINALSLKYFV